jgi:kynurenine formamidase
LVDLSHVITEGLDTYPGLPAPHIFEHLDRTAAEAFYGPGVTFTIGMITICSNTGTYIDMPYHRFADGHDLTGLALERVADVDALCIDCRDVGSIGPDRIAGLDLADRAVLFRTDHSRHFATPASSTIHLRRNCRGARRCGYQMARSTSTTEGLKWTTGSHAPLGSGIPIIEHLTGLDASPDGFRFTAVP